MNNLSPLGLLTCFIFSMVLNGASLTTHTVAEPSSAYIINRSNYTIYFKPESRKSNPGLDPNGAYALAPGQSYFLPFDAVTTPAMQEGQIYRLPTGSRLVVDESGVPQPDNIIATAGSLLGRYGFVPSPCVNFAKLSNSKHILFKTPDIIARR